MAKYLVIVESPAKSKTIKKYLGSNYRVEASMGHIRDLPKSKLGIDIEHDFEPEYINIRGKGDLIKKLKEATKNVDKIFLATDPDREGEAISWHLYHTLGLDKKNVVRIAFHEITEGAIKSAIKNSREIDMNLVDAQQARRVLDRLVGYELSPMLWRKIAKGLSAGRVQSVALKLICDREEEIEKFKPVEYWTIDALLDFKGDEFLAKLTTKNNEKINIPNKDEAMATVLDLKKGKYNIKEVKEGTKNRNPYMPFKTSTLQQSAFAKLGFSTKKTMQVAQQLYEGINLAKFGYVGLITYMRTDSTRISDEFKEVCANFITDKYGEKYLGNFERKEKASKNMQDAHEGVRVTDPFIKPDDIKNELSPDQYKLYKLIWERSISSLMAPAVYNTITLDIENGVYGLKANGSNIMFDGFMKCYGITKEDDEDMHVPSGVKEGDALKSKDVYDRQHFTEPPARFSEASLVKELEENGIGRPSTYATIISTIIDRRYIEKEEKKLMPTELGLIVNDLLVTHFSQIDDVAFTADIEKQLDSISNGEFEWKETIRNFYKEFKPLLDEADKKIEKVEMQVEESDEVCELCGRKMIVKQGKFGKFLACPGFPECRNTKSIVVKTGTHCPKCGSEVLLKKSRRGKTFYTCINSPDTCDFISWDKPMDERCPECGEQLYETGLKNKRLVCRNEKCKVGEPVKATTKKTTSKKGTKIKTTATTGKKSTSKKKTTTKAKKKEK